MKKRLFCLLMALLVAAAFAAPAVAFVEYGVVYDETEALGSDALTVLGTETLPQATTTYGVDLRVDIFDSLDNADEEAQRRRRREAWQSVIFYTIVLLLTGFGLLFLRWYYRIDGFGGVVMMIGALLELGMLIPIWILLKVRLKEIDGGEEDAAAQY